MRIGNIKHSLAGIDIGYIPPAEAEGSYYRRLSCQIITTA